MAIRRDTAQLIIEIDSAQSREFQKTVNDTKQLVKELRKAEIGGEEYNAALGKIIESNRSLQGADFTRLTGKNLRDRRRQLFQLRDTLTQTAFAEAGFEKELKDVNEALRQQRGRLQQTEKRVGVFKSSVLSLVPAIGVAFAVTKISQFFRFLFTNTNKLDAVRNRFETVFGDSAQAVEDFGERNAATLGLTIGQYQEATAAAGDLLVPLGFQRDEAASLTLDITNLSGALSEWTGGQRSTADVIGIVNKAILGEREQLKELGVSIQEADVSQRLATKGQKDFTGEALKQAKALATLELITERSSDAVSSFENNTNKGTRAVRSSAARLRQLSETLGKRLKPAFDFVLTVGERVVQLFTNTAAEGTKLSRTAQAVAGFFKIVGFAIKTAFEVSQNVLSGIIKGLTAFTKLPLIRAFFEPLKRGFEVATFAMMNASATIAGFEAAINQMTTNVLARLTAIRSGFRIAGLSIKRAFTFNDEDRAALDQQIAGFETIRDSALSLGGDVGAAFSKAFVQTISEDLQKRLNEDNEIKEIILPTFEEIGKRVQETATSESGAGSNTRRRETATRLQSTQSGERSEEDILKERIENISSALDRELELYEIHALKKLSTEEQFEIASLEARAQAEERKLQLLLSAGKAQTDQYRKIELEKLRLEAETQAKREQIAARDHEFKQKIAEAGIQTAQDTFTTFAQLLGQDEKARRKNATAIKAFEQARIITNMYAEISEIQKSFAALGPIGQIFAGIRVGLVFARATAAVNTIAGQKFEAGGKMKKSGTFAGPSHRDGGIKGVFSDGTEVEVEGNENFYILNKNSSALINTLGNINALGGGVKFNDGGAINFASGIDVSPTGINNDIIPQTANSSQSMAELTRILGRVELALNRFPKYAKIDYFAIQETDREIADLEDISSF